MLAGPWCWGAHMGTLTARLEGLAGAQSASPESFLSDWLPIHHRTELLSHANREHQGLQGWPSPPPRGHVPLPANMPPSSPC